MNDPNLTVDELKAWNSNLLVSNDILNHALHRACQIIFMSKNSILEGESYESIMQSLISEARDHVLSD